MEDRPATKHRRVSPALLLWLGGIVLIVALDYVDDFLERLGHSVAILDFFAFLTWLLVIGLTLYGTAVVIRWILTRLFWTVGRRLFLSYLLVSVLPFFLMAILLLTVAYMFAAVMTQAAVRAERQATLGQLENWALEYATTGKRPGGALPTLEIYDTAAASGQKLPPWLQKKSFSGLVGRDRQALLVTARQFPGEVDHAVVLAQPIDKAWTDQLHDRWRMTVRTADARVTRGRNNERNYDIKAKNELSDVVRDKAFKEIIWGDIADLADWNTGAQISDWNLLTLISNPPDNLFSYYFGAAANDYFGILLTVVASISVVLLMMYGIAALFAAVLIFSISRAVNRIEKGTKAVERGDFSYRIRMRRNNQLGAMAQSFDHMTESIASLLTTVAEKERLQSEIAIAADIQRNLLPKEGPDHEGVSFAAHFEPTTSIGGDYYDVFKLSPTRLAVAIGDVSGHGLSTGLVMAMVKAAMTTLIEEGADETSLFRRLNELVHRSTERRAFMTLAFTVFDLERGTIRHTNAGHIYPYILRRDGTATSIDSPSLPLGVRPVLVARTVETELHEGDTLVYVSDGIIEAQDEQGEPLGFDQLESLLGGCTTLGAEEVRNAILDAVAQHAGAKPADDDRTVMVVRFDRVVTAATASVWTAELQAT
ncbi:MAG TPA: SpoIIE family protein phosphatase [Thermoanaerobaculia bacterium]|nr:SpoIIE family protein phosphatase [Thermoanaerobaculia bacterium]